MERLHQAVLIGSTLLGSWLAMQAVHELGHLLGAWATGARVVRVVLTPTAISRTDVAENRRPLVVVWAGPIVGTCVPVAMWLVARTAGWPAAFALRFFAGFCLVANGLYIAGGSIGRVGDCREMLRHGSAPWQLWLFGAVTAPAGFVLWHGQGEAFGLGAARGHVSRAAAYGTLAVCAVLLALGFAIDGG